MRDGASGLKLSLVRLDRLSLESHENEMSVSECVWHISLIMLLPCFLWLTDQLGPEESR